MISLVVWQQHVKYFFFFLHHLGHTDDLAAQQEGRRQCKACLSGSDALQVTSYEEDAAGVTVHFDRGQPSVHAKVLIGADGYFSRIRKQCLNDGPPMFAVSPCFDHSPLAPPPPPDSRASPV